MAGIKVQDLTQKALPDGADRLLAHDPAEPGAVKEKTVSVSAISAKAAADRLAGLVAATGLLPADLIEIINAGTEKKITWANFLVQLAADFAAPPAPAPKNQYQYGFAGLADGYNLEIALVVKPAAAGYAITQWPAGFASLVEYSLNGLTWSSVLPAVIAESLVYARISFAAGSASGIVKLTEN